MNTNLRTRFLSAGIFFVLIASAVFTVPARADSGSPPPAPTAPGGSTHGAAQVPSGGTNTSGGGDQGHKVELSSQNAAYIAPAGDPIWCPSGVAVPVPGAGGCSANYPNLYALTNAVETLAIHPVLTNSNIWIQHGADTSIGQPVLDGSVLAALSNVSLNFKGGWNGLGTGSVNPANPSTFTQGLRILSWNNNITLSDVQFSNVVSGTLEGIYITTKGNISLTRVQANNNPGFGAYLNNTSGAGTVSIVNGQFNGDALPIDEALEVLSNNAITLTNVIANNGWSTIINNNTGSNKAVTIKSSSFDNTHATGVIVFSKGAITLTNISASGNYNASSDGAFIDNTASITAAPVTLTGTNIFDSNLGTGLLVKSNGKITSASINASNNSAAGASFDNHTASTPLSVTLTGNSSFNGNGGDGLDIKSPGIITVNNVSANGNTHYGVFLENDYSPSTPSAINVTGTNWITFNGWDGMDALSDGPISLNNINANGNGTVGTDDGLYAENKAANTAQSIKLTGVNNFNNNSLSGALLQATGPVIVNNVTAIGNSLGYGLTIQNDYLGATMPQSVTLLGHNLMSNNQNDNLDISTYGAITINSLTASNSVSGKGAYLGFGPATPGNVTLNGLSTFNNNSGEGLLIASKGIVLTNGLNAISNGGGGVVINNSFSGGPSPVTLKGINTFNFNGLGLEILTKGAVITNGLSAVSNTSDGVEIINNIAFTSPVTLKGLNTFSKNTFSGLVITTRGTVVTNGLNAISNNSTGVIIDNHFSTTSAPVTLMGINTMNNNTPDGLLIESKGAVLTNNLNVISNGVNGVVIDNCLFSVSACTTLSAAPVTLKGISTINHNGVDGLIIASNGAVLTNGLSVLSNGANGAIIDNHRSSFSSPVTVMGSNTFNMNGAVGLIIESKGTVLTNSLIALSNAAPGVIIDNDFSSTSAPVTLKGLSTFIDNGSDGLEIASKGTVITNGLMAISNTGSGAIIDNHTASISAAVTLNGLNTFNSSGSVGLIVFSNGAVLTNNLNVLNNKFDGMSIDNHLSISAPVTLKGLNNFKNNGLNGIIISSHGAVLTNNLNALGNGSDGVFITNSSSSLTPPVTLNGTNTFNSNGLTGLDITSKGAITTNNLTASYNGIEGAYINNGLPGGVGAINAKGRNIFWDNMGGDGIDLFSNGPVTVTNISSKWNSNDGFLVNTAGNVLVSCGSFISNGTSHITGYGWETGLGVSHITLIGVTSAGNFSGDFNKVNPSTLVTMVPHPCSLP